MRRGRSTHSGSRWRVRSSSGTIRSLRPLRPLLAPPQALPTRVREPAAVHGKGMSVDEAAPFRIGEESDGPGNVLRRSETGHRDAALDIRVGVAATGLVLLVHLRLHPAGAYSVDADAASSPLRGEGAGQPDQTVLASVVSRPVGNAEQPRHGANVHDAPRAPLEHHLAELPAHEERPGQVHRECPVPFRECRFLRGHDGADAGVVYQHVYSVELVHHSPHHPAYRRLVRDVARYGERLRSGGAQLFQSHLRCVQVIGGDPVTFLGQHEGDAASDASGGSGNNGDLFPFLHSSLLLFGSPEVCDSATLSLAALYQGTQVRHEISYPFTGVFGSWPARTATIFSAARAAILLRVSMEALPMCGASTTFSSSRSFG